MYDFEDMTVSPMSDSVFAVNGGVSVTDVASSVFSEFSWSQFLNSFDNGSQCFK